MGTVLLKLEQSFNLRHFSKLKFIFSDLFEDVIYLAKDIVTPFDIIVERFVETVGSCVNKLDTPLRCNLGDSVISFFGRNIQLIVPHGS